MLKSLSFLFLSLFSAVVIGQEDINSLQRLNRIEMYIQNRQFNDAEKLVLPMLTKESNNKYLNYYAALCQLASGKTQESLPYFKQVFEINTSGQDLVNPSIYIGKGTIIGADTKIPDKESFIDNGLIFDFKIPYSNICMSDDGQTLVYVDPTASENKIYYLKCEKNIWSKPVDISKQLGSDGTYFPSSISYDSKRIYFTHFDNFESNIFVSSFDGKNWSSLKKLNSNINSLHSDAHACENETGTVLYFASDRPGGFGAMDLYYSNKVNNDWTKPVNCGSRINTFLNEDYPSSVNNGNNLIFCSQGVKKGKDGYDLYVCNTLSENQWSEPINLLYPFNTSDDDISFIPFSAPTRKFFNIIINQLKKEESGLANKPVKLLNVSGKIELQVPKSVGSEGAIVVQDLSGRLAQKNIIPDSVGNFKFILPEGAYKISATYTGYKSAANDLLVPFVLKADTIKMDFRLEPEK